VDGLSIRALPGDYISKPGMRPGFQEGPMKYLCLIYDHEQTMAGMSEADANAFMGEYFAFTNGIKASGHYVAGEVLKPVNTATTVRLRGGKVSTTDGPFAETKEQPGRIELEE